MVGWLLTGFWRHILALLLCYSLSAAQASEPWRVHEVADMPEWLALHGETRLRYESLSNQFRRDGAGADQLLLARSLVFLGIDFGRVDAAIELQDARSYLGDTGTPLSSSFVDPLDFLQIYLGFDAPGLLHPEGKTRFWLGRQTINIGSARQIERVNFANVIKSYTGLYGRTTHPDGHALHAFFVVPVGRFPGELEALLDNELDFDEEQWERRIWALHYRHRGVLPVLPELWTELFVYGLDESDSVEVPTPNRHYAWPGLRVFRPPAPAQWDVDLEAAWRFGSRRATSDPEDTEDLDVSAAMFFLALGYTLDRPWRPRLALEYYLATGDEDPRDDRFDQFERLFGSRRGDLNNTSIHGPLTPANLNAPGFRIEVKPSNRVDARLYYHAAFLASDTDAFVIAGLRDRSGQSGDFIGHTLDGRVRYWVVPGSLRLEVGASGFWYGDFTKDVSGGPSGTRTIFGYTSIEWLF